MNTVRLPEIAKVKASQELLKPQAITADKKRELRFQAVKDLVRSKPAGERIRLGEIAKATHVNDDSSAQSIINLMIKRGELQRHEVGPNHIIDGHYYTVPEDTKTIVPASNQTIHPQPTIEALTLPQLEQAAAMYAWSNDIANTNELKNFIKYLRNDR